MLVAVLFVIGGLGLLVWSADRFVEGAAVTARYAGMPPLLIGMLIVGFGTSMPEMVVSILSSLQGAPNIALGNAYGSNIANISLILGITALIAPIQVHSRILKIELPLLALVTAVAAFQMRDGLISRLDAFVLIGMFFAVFAWSIYVSRRGSKDDFGSEMETELKKKKMSLFLALFWLAIGFGTLILSSRILVMGAVEIARSLGVSELVIGLTVVAIGTSLPELASSVVATRKGEHDIALGNVIGSNLFNTLIVVGLAGSISPLRTDPILLMRDLPIMGGLTLSLFVMGYGFRGQGKINRVEGGILLLSFVLYTSLLVYSAAH